jgi:pimeloyl-ACP methyl ester carboxylesterase
MIHALPGMGADHRMFPPPWTELPNFIAHDWIHHAGETTLAEVAHSMCSACGIRDGDTLIGASLGGMVACEITKIRNIPALYLVGSATRKEEVSALLATLHPLAQIAPLDWLRYLSGKIPLEAAQMFSNAEPSFIRAMCAAIFQWQGLAETATTVFRLHGARDHIILPPPHADLLLDTGHLISITRAAECVAFIKERAA